MPSTSPAPATFSPAAEWEAELPARAREIFNQIGVGRALRLGIHDAYRFGDYNACKLGISFKASGRHFPKGCYVRVILWEGKDLYQVQIQDLRRLGEPPAVDEHDIYCDVLGELLEGWIG